MNSYIKLKGGSWHIQLHNNTNWARCGRTINKPIRTYGYPDGPICKRCEEWRKIDLAARP